MKRHNGKKGHCWASEKCDGVQGKWTGSSLTTRTGQPISCPEWWGANLPNVPLVGELWLGRGRFEETLSIVSCKTPDDRWGEIRFMVFDIPTGCTLTGVAEPVQRWETDNPKGEMDKIVKLGGEGIVVRDDYGEDRKLKPITSMDAIVLEHLPGKGKASGLTGSLKVKSESGHTFKIGAGMTLAQRENPPSIGSLVEIAYEGLTKTGKPKCARLYRKRIETPSRSFVAPSKGKKARKVKPIDIPVSMPIQVLDVALSCIVVGVVCSVLVGLFVGLLCLVFAL